MKCGDDGCRHYICGGCGVNVCPDLWPSPGEPDLCGECCAIDDPEAVA